MAVSENDGEASIAGSVKGLLALLDYCQQVPLQCGALLGPSGPPWPLALAPWAPPLKTLSHWAGQREL